MALQHSFTILSPCPHSLSLPSQYRSVYYAAATILLVLMPELILHICIFKDCSFIVDFVKALTFLPLLGLEEK